MQELVFFFLHSTLSVLVPATAGAFLPDLRGYDAFSSIWRTFSLSFILLLFVEYHVQSLVFLSTLRYLPTTHVRFVILFSVYLPKIFFEKRELAPANAHRPSPARTSIFYADEPRNPRVSYSRHNCNSCTVLVTVLLSC